MCTFLPSIHLILFICLFLWFIPILKFVLENFHYAIKDNCQKQIFQKMAMEDIIRENELELFNETLSNNLTFDTQKLQHTIGIDFYVLIVKDKNI